MRPFFGIRQDEAVSPEAISGLVLDFDSRFGVVISGPDVSTWTDTVGGFVVSAVSGGAIYNATGGPRGVPSLTFGGGAHLKNTTDNPLSAGGDRTVFVMGKQATYAGAAITFRESGNLAGFFLLANGGGAFVYTDGVAINETITAQPTISSPSIIDWTYHVGSVVGLRINGTGQAVSGSAVTNADNGGTGFSIGYSDAAGADNWNGDIDRILVYNRVLSAGEIQLVEHGLAVLYGIPGM